jgi:hypothetical protein
MKPAVTAAPAPAPLPTTIDGALGGGAKANADSEAALVNSIALVTAVRIKFLMRSPQIAQADL